MKIAVFGLGYVGSVSAASFAAAGHEVIGVDANAGKVATVNAGHSPVVEPGLDELIGRGVARGALPGTTHGLVIPALESASGKTYGLDFGVSVNPEFLREGTALNDFQRPPMTIVGHNHAADAARTMELYPPTAAPLVNTSIRVAEMLKYTSNAWHALKVCFANEIGNLCKRVGVDSHEL